MMPVRSKRSDWRVTLAILLAGVVGAAGAETGTVVGLWQRLPVASGGKIVAVPNLLFTNRKLGAATTFTGLQDAGRHLRVICCVQVRKLEPLKVADLLKAYAADADVVGRIKAVEGLPYVYEAAPVARTDWNEFMHNVMHYSDKPELDVPFSVPVTSAPLGKALRVDKAFKVGEGRHELAIAYDDAAGRVRYRYKDGADVVTFSANAPSGE
ncbi:hypothetical protein [Pseudoduganella buxea]|uniref:Uncharacterized protein n=1 Tax=Pseudoduganella buxea TaxID=1949069 RepID=A0A6I3T4G1_9BURK|nr:hypothetical protein [Pseudoduganella buxea]MTV55372.1 hypothetical protein [Pseudoduganella buxea]GGC13809.1 hypothetical protein GCM10011572_39000 [Pseudoduganella buxea]